MLAWMWWTDKCAGAREDSARGDPCFGCHGARAPTAHAGAATIVGERLSRETRRRESFLERHVFRPIFL